MSIGKKKIVGTYLLSNRETGETYIGSGILKKREQAHFRDLNAGAHVNCNLQKAFDNNQNFDFIGLEAETIEDARNREQELLDFHQGNPLLLNISKSAHRCIVEHTEESRRKIGDAHRGKILSQEVRDKLSIARKGSQLSQETREKLRKIQLERMSDPIQRAKCVSMGGLGKSPTAEAREKMRNAKVGIPLSPEHRQALSAARAGKVVPENIRQQGLEVRRKKVVVDGIVYESLTSAALAHGINPSSAHNRLTNSKKFDNWTYLSEEQSNEKT